METITELVNNLGLTVSGEVRHDDWPEVHMEARQRPLNERCHDDQRSPVGSQSFAGRRVPGVPLAVLGLLLLQRIHVKTCCMNT